jgi:hypothetical protein
MVVLPLEEARGWSARRWPSGQRALTLLASLLLVIMLAQNIDHLFRRYFPREEYGSLNGAVTQAMIEIWPSLPPDAPVYFFGGDRMGFASIPSITYLRPQAQATDVDRVDLILPDVSELIAFVLSDETDSLNALRARFHEGIVLPRYNRNGRLLFHLFATGEAAQALSSALP